MVSPAQAHILLPVSSASAWSNIGCDQGDPFPPAESGERLAPLSRNTFKTA